MNTNQKPNNSLSNNKRTESIHNFRAAFEYLLFKVAAGFPDAPVQDLLTVHRYGFRFRIPSLPNNTINESERNKGVSSDVIAATLMI